VAVHGDVYHGIVSGVLREAFHLCFISRRGRRGSRMDEYTQNGRERARLEVKSEPSWINEFGVQ
jgi:hypothetical protein